MQFCHKLYKAPNGQIGKTIPIKRWLLAPAGKLTILYFTQQDTKHRVQDAESKQKLSKPNITQSNSKATNVGVRHSSQVTPPTPQQTFQPLLDQLES